MPSIVNCLGDTHDTRLLGLAALICVVGVYASYSVARHAARCEDGARRRWALAAIVAAGCTAWATHMIALLAFRPGMPSAFDPVLTALSLLMAIGGIGLGMTLSIGRRERNRRFLAGIVLGLGVTLLHYLGQASYLVTGRATWDAPLVAASVLVALLMCGVAMIASAERSRARRRLSAPLLLAAIAVLHVGGMAALTLDFDPRVRLPAGALAPETLAPIVAAVGFGLVLLAVLGLRFTLNAAAQARRDRERLRELANLALEGLAICDGDRVASANDSLERLSGLSKAELVGRPLAALLPGLSLADLPEREERDAELAGLDGHLVPVRVLHRTVRFGDKLQTVIALRDQRERMETEAAMRTLAFTDPLTGLANRARFNDLLAIHAAAGQTGGRRFALLLLDLDRFKWVNDTLGHGAGDELLRQVTGRLREAAGPGDVVARLGGDEFAVIVPDDGNGARAGAQRVAQGAVERLARSFLVNGQTLEIAVSIGIAVSPEDGQAPDELSRRADLALYRAKQEGGSTHRLFEAEMDAFAQARRALEADLRKALARAELSVHYQPQVDPRTGAFQGAEALVRWTHPERGMVPPAEFIPIAEEVGLIGAIGEWVLRTACAEAATWPPELSIAVNLSPLQLRDRRLVAAVSAILADTGLPAARLELEVTESALLQDDGSTYGNLHSLRDLGIRISMDDFGTGYSSLSHLRRFPFDKIKIDQSFVRQVPHDPDSVAIVQAIASLGAKLRMNVTVEGVETHEQQAFAVREGCDQIQGYLISRPIPADAVRQLFTTAAPAAA